MTQTNDRPSLPQNIGLALSGGGYRAAVFHLGVLTYLKRVKLLSSVKMISTVSGGTFTGAKYTLSLVEGKSFSEFYQEYCNFFQQNELVELALQELGKKESHISSQRIDLITAAANVYAQKFLKKPDGNPYRLRDIFAAQIPLTEVVFNATEFRHGIAFRFQCSSNSNSRIGNQKISIPKHEAGDIRLADIVAASSCFPGGFEPLAFPDDFNWSNEQILQSVKDIVYRNGQKAIALMDGGIYDNQGIESLWLANQRNNDMLDLFVISDVDQQEDSLYDFPELLNISNLTLQGVDWSAKILTLLCFGTLISIGVEAIQSFINQQFNWLDIFLYIVPILLASATIFLLTWGRKTIINQILAQVPQVGRFSWKYLKKLTINQIANGIYLRLSSLQAMAGSVFMKRIRRQGLAFIYRQYGKQQKEKLIANFIYDLSSDNPKVDREFSKLPGINKPGVNSNLQKIIDGTAKMPTTLWFTKDNQLDELIISGEATICYNLMRYIVRNYGNDPSSYPDKIRLFWDGLVADWHSLSSNPQVLL